MSCSRGWVCKKTRRRFIQLNETELKEKLASIWEILQIGFVPDSLANRDLVLVRAAHPIERLPQRRHYV